MPKKLTNEEIDRRLIEDGRGFIRTTNFAGVSKPMGLRCLCGNNWMARPDNVLGTLKRGCPSCAGTLALTNEDIDKRLEQDGRGFIRTTNLAGVHKQIGFLCPTGHHWMASPSNVLGTLKRGCPHCAGRGRRDNDIDAMLVADGRGFIRLSEFKGMLKPLMWKCQDGHQWSAAPSSVLMSKTGCPVCAGNMRLTSEEVDRRFLEDGRGYSRTTDYSGVGNPIGIRCSVGHQWTTTPSSVLGAQKTGCPICAGFGRTNEDIDAMLLEDGRGYTRTTNFAGMAHSMGFMCSSLHRWEAVPARVLNTGCGCPHCAITGFDPRKPAYTYFLKLESRFAEAYKVGISNNGGDARVKGLQPKAGVTITVIDEIFFENGADAMALEKLLLAKYAHIKYPPLKGKELVGNGHTELFTQNIWALEHISA